jgi:hypothetical protein
MEQVGEENASRRGASANRWAADAHALALLPTIRTLMAAGFVSQRALANELNRRRIPTARGGSWHRTSIARVLARLGLARDGFKGLAVKRAVKVRAEALGQTFINFGKLASPLRPSRVS